MDWTGRRVLVVGYGRSGRDAVRLALRRGARVAVSEAGDNPKLRSLLEPIRAELEAVEWGGHTPELFSWADTIVISPGVPLAQPLFTQARERGARIIGEVELAFGELSCPLLGITGTKGKSTTTVLTGEILKAAGKRVFVGGNLGQPLSEALLDDATLDLAVVELSSFQLETIVELRPIIGAFLNLASDHQDRYPDMTAYAAAKMRLFARQLPGDAAVFNAEDAGVMRFAGSLPGRLFTFNGLQANAFCTDQDLVLRLTEREQRIPLRAYRLPGRHNRENLAAAALLATLAGADPAAIESAMVEFRGLPHRLEDLGEKKGVRFINDSKATTPGAVRTSLLALDRPAVLILGGRDKGTDWTVLAGLLREKCAAVVAYGEAAELIAGALPDAAMHRVGPMAEALEWARAAARSGEAILLSPGCASFDQFANFEERGEAMRRWVEAQ